MKSKLASLLCCLIVLINLSGCTKVTQLVKDSQPTKAELLDEINTEHQRWEAAPAADPTPYLRHYDVLADVLGSSRSLCRLLCLQVVRDIGPHPAQHGDDEQDEGDRAGKEGCVAAVGVADALTKVALKLAGQDEGQN